MTRLSFAKEMRPVLSSSNSLNTFMISSFESLVASKVRIKSAVSNHFGAHDLLKFVIRNHGMVILVKLLDQFSDISFFDLKSKCTHGNLQLSNVDRA